MLANREGIFHAYPVDIGLGETREKKLLQVNIMYRLFEELVNGEWVDCTADNLEITGYHILEKRDHSLNETTIEALKAAFGWDGRDPFYLQDNAAALALLPVQIKLAFEEYNGQQNLKVQYLNPYGSQRGGIAKADDSTRRAVGNRLGSKFRALAGGTPANPPKPAGKPTVPATATASSAPPAAATPATSAPTAAAPAPSAPPKPATSKPAAPPPQASVPAAPSAPVAPAAPTASTATMEQAWAEFVKHCPPDQWSQDATEKEWFRVIGILFPNKRPGQLTGADWAVMLAQGAEKIIPF